MRLRCVGLLLCLTLGCGGGAPTEMGSSSTLHRRTNLWIDSPVGAELGRDLQRAGVSCLVVRRGRIDLGTGAPVLHLVPALQVAGDIPVASALRLETGAAGVGSEVATVLWKALAPSLGPRQSEIILDLPQTLVGMDAFIRRFRLESSLKVVPVLTSHQLSTADGLAVARTVGEIIVPLFGAPGVGLRGVEQGAHESIRDLVRGLVGQGVKLRPAIVIRPATEPRLAEWGDDLDALCEGRATEVRASTQGRRLFVFSRPMTWSGRSWSAGERLEMVWMDASRLNEAFREICRLVLPEVSGWDLFSLPPKREALGLGSDALLGYLGGRGPTPEIEARVSRQGRTLSVELVNRSPFTSAVTEFGNWLEVSVASGTLMVHGAGDFERLTYGAIEGGQWQGRRDGRGQAVRFVETYVGPRETVRAGKIVLPSSRTEYRVRWRVLLSDGTEVAGGP